MTTDLLTAAIYYTSDLHWPIFPCEARGKKPLTPNGLHDASADPDDAWPKWERWPNANIGLATGKRADIVVLDIDGAAGHESLLALEDKYGPLPPTLTSRTGREGGGTHLHFAHGGDDVRNSAGRVGEGLDVRGEGGYIILPPSVHESGRRYEWLNDLAPAPLPAWLHRLMLPPVATALPRAAITAAPDAMQRARCYLAKIKPPAQGQRNAAFFNAAGHLIHGFGLAESAVHSLLVGFNLLCDPPLDETEIRTVVHSARVNGVPREAKPQRTPARVRLAMACASRGIK